MFEVGGFLAGVISEAELAAQAIMLQLTSVAYIVSNCNKASKTLKEQIVTVADRASLKEKKQKHNQRCMLIMII